jgi:hypothetical protein
VNSMIRIGALFVTFNGLLRPGKASLLDDGGHRMWIGPSSEASDAARDTPRPVRFLEMCEDDWKLALLWADQIGQAARDAAAGVRVH